MVVDDTNEAGRTAPKLNVWPTGRADCGQKEAVPLREVLLLVIGQRVGARNCFGPSTFAIVKGLAAVFELRGADIVGERDHTVVFAHVPAARNASSVSTAMKRIIASFIGR